MTVTLGDASYTITHDPNGTPKDISAYLLDGEILFKSNEFPTAKLTFDAEFGQFITESTSGNTPIFDEWQEIEVSVTDKNDNTKSLIFFIEDLLGDRNTAQGLTREIQCLARISYLQWMPIGKDFDYENAFVALRDMVDKAKDGKGSAQPDIEGHDSTSFNEMPKWTANNYRFSNGAEYMAWDGIKELIEILGASVANKGSGDFWSVKSQDKSGDKTVVELLAFSAGSKPASPVTIQQTTADPLFSIHESKRAKSATIVGIWGPGGSGDLETNFSEFRSIVEEFINIPAWQSGVVYPAGTFVNYAGTTYEKDTSTGTDTPPTNWTAKTIDDTEFLGTKQYSPWTEDKHALWKNSGTNPLDAGSDFDQAGCWDSNLVVLDEDNYQNYVKDKATAPTGLSVFFKYGEVSGGDFRGLRALVFGTGTGDWAGNDSQGKAFANALVQHNGSEWRVIGPIGDNGIRAPVSGDTCVVEDEGYMYKFNGTIWVDDHATPKAQHCIHVYDSISNAQGISELSDGVGNYGLTSAVKYTYKYSPWSTVTNELFALVNYFSIGCWANFSFPFPSSTHNGIGEDLGQLFGGTAATKEPATLNTDNLDLTPTGLSGFNKADSASLGPLESLDFSIKLNWYITALGDVLGTIGYQGNFKMRAVCYDTSDNVVVHDFVIEHMNHFEPIHLPLEEFKTYRARVPLRFGNILSNLIRPELEVLNRFEWKNLKKVGIQLQEVYDDEGRYKPEGTRWTTVPALSGEVAIDLYIDAWRFGKRALALSPTVSAFPRFEDFMESDITSTRQLNQAVLGQLAIEVHRYRGYDVNTELRGDVDEDDSFYLVDSEMLSDNDDASGGIKLVAREHKITIKSSEGVGGIRSHLKGVQRP